VVVDLAEVRVMIVVSSLGFESEVEWRYLKPPVDSLAGTLALVIIMTTFRLVRVNPAVGRSNGPERLEIW